MTANRISSKMLSSYYFSLPQPFLFVFLITVVDDKVEVYAVTHCVLVMHVGPSVITPHQHNSKPRSPEKRLVWKKNPTLKKICDLLRKIVLMFSRKFIHYHMLPLEGEREREYLLYHLWWHFVTERRIYIYANKSMHNKVYCCRINSVCTKVIIRQCGLIDGHLSPWTCKATPRGQTDVWRGCTLMSPK